MAESDTSPLAAAKSQAESQGTKRVKNTKAAARTVTRVAFGIILLALVSWYAPVVWSSFHTAHPASHALSATASDQQTSASEPVAACGGAFLETSDPSGNLWPQKLVDVDSRPEIPVPAGCHIVTKGVAGQYLLHQVMANGEDCIPDKGQCREGETIQYAYIENLTKHPIYVSVAFAPKG